MKKIILTLNIFLFCFCFTFCKQNTTSKASVGFISPALKPAEYENVAKEKVDLLDSDIIYKIDNLDSYFDGKARNNGFNGAVLISYKGTPIFERYYGYKNYNTKEKITPSSSFQIASTSKTFTSAAILLLLQQNMLSLEDTLQKFLPNFPYKGITVRMLLNHRSGLPDYTKFYEDYWKNKSAFMSNDDVLQMMIRFKPKVYNSPDSHFRYNNSNFVILALIVEKVSGVPFCDFMHQNIFIPLGMTDTWIFDPRNVRPSATKGYKSSKWYEDEMVPTDGVTGDKNIYSTVRDLYKWDQALYVGKFIRSEYLGMAFTPQSFEKAGNKNYGLGWRMTDQADGSRMIYHNGWWHSYTTAFNRKISDKSTIIVLSNHFVSNSYHSQEIWDILYGGSVISTQDDEGKSETTKKLNSDGLMEMQEK